MESNHTSGPWLRSGCHVYALVGEGKRAVNRFCAAFQSGGEAGAPDDELEANARLAEAAPDLLAAAEVMVDAWDRFYADEGSVNPLDYITGDNMEPLRAAIARAKGGASS